MPMMRSERPSLPATVTRLPRSCSHVGPGISKLPQRLVHALNRRRVPRGLRLLSRGEGPDAPQLGGDLLLLLVDLRARDGAGGSSRLSHADLQRQLCSWPRRGLAKPACAGGDACSVRRRADLVCTSRRGRCE